MRRLAASLAAGATAAALALSAALPAAAADAPEVAAQRWSWTGLFGTFDRAALQRGFVVYKDVCSACHGLRLVAYRNLAEIGFSEDAIKAVAATVEIEDGPDDEGEHYMRPGRPSDRFKSPAPNDEAARALNNGALPPDLSLLTKALPGGPDYIHAVMTGFEDAPPGMTVPEGMHYNRNYAGNMIAMAPPLTEDGVEYADGTKATVAQQAHDVTTFLAWAAEPELEERKRMGVKVILFLLLMTGLLYVAKRRIWRDVH